MLTSCEKGQVYYIKYPTLYDQPVFNTAALCIQFIQMLKYYAVGFSSTRFSKVSIINDKHIPLRVVILAYCILPTEYHILIYQVSSDGVYQCLKRLHEAITRYTNALFKQSGKIFDTRAAVISPVNIYDIDALAEDIHGLPIFTTIPTYISSRHKYPWSSYHDVHVTQAREVFIRSARVKAQQF